MLKILFITGNEEKIKDAQLVCEEYNIKLETKNVAINEIQHHNPLEITKHKAITAHASIKAPLIVNDSFWSIPALGGFPGGYMKDVASWLTPGDFLNLMSDKKDQSIVLTDVNGYYDGKKYHSFSTVRYGSFINEIRGRKGPSFTKVVKMEDTMTLSEVFDQPKRVLSSSRYEQWHDFAKWYVEQNK